MDKPKCQSDLHKATAELFGLMPLSDFVEAVADGAFESLESNVGAHDEENEGELTVTTTALAKVWTSMQLIIGLTKMYEAHKASESLRRKGEVSND